MICPAGVMQHITQGLRNLFWKGGKTNAKKIHFVNWSIVRDYKDNHNIGIKYPSFMNLALGTKIIWRLISRKYDWWKKVFYKKYYVGERKRCIKNLQDLRSGSPILKLLKAVTLII
jgi:hypothetical protein